MQSQAMRGGRQQRVTDDMEAGEALRIYEGVPAEEVSSQNAAEGQNTSTNQAMIPNKELYGKATKLVKTNG